MSPGEATDDSSRARSSASAPLVRTSPLHLLPGSGVPHPIRDPRGHSHNRRFPTPPTLDHETWAENRCYLWALDLFNNGFYWEAHEEWERLWRATGSESNTGKFLKGMIKLAAAGIKVREKSLHGVRRHAASAGEVFADVAADVGTDFYCGLELTNLQYAADRAAQLSYKQPFPAGSRFASSRSC